MLVYHFCFLEESKEHAISFWQAWLIPGVIPYAISIAWVKCSTYGILFWLPSYADKQLHYSHADIGMLAFMYDLGVIIGTIVLGKVSDMIYKKRAPVAFIGLISGGIWLGLFILLSNSSKYILWLIIFFVGFFVGSIFNIVAAVAAADLAKGEHLRSNLHNIFQFNQHFV